MGSSEEFGSDATLGADATEAGHARELVERESQQSQIGRYLVIDELGRGAMGLVFRAYDPQLDRRVALKLIRGDPASEGARARLLREAQAMARLHHPNVIAVHDAGVHNDDVYVAMELFDGITLGQWMKEERPWREVVGVFLRAARGLSAAHAAGLVHRDFKPGNAMVGPDGDVRVLDFGLARVDNAEDLGKTDSVVSDPRLTQTGHVLGTPAYMAPEQWHGEEVDAAADQFAFCVSLYEALSGHRPFEADSVEGLMTVVLDGRIAEPRRVGTPGWLRAVVRRGLSTAKEDRFASMDELVLALRRGLVGRRRTVAIAGVAAVGVVAAVGLRSGADPHPCPPAGPQLEDVWGDGAGAAIDAKFRALPGASTYSGEAATRAVASLDDYAAGWVAAYKEACEATRVHARQPPEVLQRRLACLERHRRSLGFAADVLQEPDRETVLRSARVVETLEPHDRCLAIDALEGTVGRGPPAIEQAIIAKLDEAMLDSAAGRFEVGLRVVQEAQVQAEATGFVWLVARAQLDRAGLLSDAGKQADADRLAQDAIASALKTDDTQLHAGAMRFYAHFLAASEPALAVQWIEFALAVRSRAPDDPESGPAFHGAAAAAYNGVGRFDDALREGERAVELARALGDAGRNSLSVALISLGHTFFDLDRGDDALAAYEESAEIRKALNGEHHPRYGAAIQSIGTVHYLRKDYEKAREVMERSLPILTGALGKDDLSVADAVNNLGLVRMELGDYERASADLMMALRIRSQQLGPGHGDVGSSYQNLGDLFAAQGERETALEHYEKALPRKEKTFGKEHPRLVSTLAATGDILVELGRAAEALPMFERAIAIESKLGDAAWIEKKLAAAR